MTSKDVIEFFGSQARVALALGIRQAAVSQWGDVPPMPRQYQIEVITEGRLKASRLVSDFPAKQVV